MNATNSRGIVFAVRVVRSGDRYGLDRCLLYNEADPMIEFYDTRCAGKGGFDTEGQFVSRYYARTLADGPDGMGLCLHGGVPDWEIDEPSMIRVCALAKEITRS